MSIYLALNVAFGTVGHLGVEPLPESWRHSRWLNVLSTSTFHVQHHGEPDRNYGFYTVIWDRLFRTLSSDYRVNFGTLSR